MNIKKYLWMGLGFLSLGMAYVGVVVPGIPFSVFLVFAAYCFTKSSKRMHDWIYNHKVFGPFLSNWQEKRIFPTKLKYVMVLTMLSSLAIMWYTVQNLTLVIATGIIMAMVAIWGFRYPGSEAEWQRRKDAGEKIV